MRIINRLPFDLVLRLLAGLLLVSISFLGSPNSGQAQTLNPNPPAVPVRLVFVHHSVGEGWLRNGEGNLLGELNANNYYVSDTYYGWGSFDPDLGGSLGDYTDIGHWYNWFLGPQSGTHLAELYANTYLNPGEGVNAIPRPAGDNTVVLFKSCFIDGYAISGNPGDPPRQSSAADPNPIWGVSAGDSAAYTVSNIKGMYRDLLAYFASHQEKLFILITSPPASSTDSSVEGQSAHLLRAINTWLVRYWLAGYPYNNVAVFDYYNVLTSNGGDSETNDLGAEAGNHHRLADGKVRHIIGAHNDFSAYTYGDDSHPTWAGHQKATGEFLPLLNVVYHAWQGTGGRPWYMGRRPDVLAGPRLLLQD